MHKRLTFATLFAANLALVASCETQPTAPDKGAPEPAAEPADEAGPAGEAAAKKSDPLCVGPIAAGTPETLEVAGTTWELNGSTLKLTSELKDGLTIGAVSDIKEDSPENLANLEKFVAWFKKKKADLIVVAGDTGLDQPQIEKSLGVLAGAGVPVFNIVGNREGKTDYRAAMDAVRKLHPNVLDLNRIRRVDTPVADLVSLPGYYNPSYIHSDDGCAYFAADVAATAELVKSCDSPVVLISHGGPEQDGPEGIDRTAEGENVGDPALTTMIADAKIPFGIFGNIHEAGGRATDLAGKTLLPAGTPHDALYLNPGPADGIRWVMNDKTESVGMAALMTIKDGKASYEINRLPPPK